MSDDAIKKPNLSLPTPAYDVGYRKPPEKNRFKSGQSGNPKGRPRGAKNRRPGLHEERLKSIVLDEAYRGVTVRDGEQNVTIPMAQAVVRAMAVKAAKGDHRSQRLFAELVSETERQNWAMHVKFMESAMTYKIEWERELARREKLDITGPEPLPHPDHVKIDMATGNVRIVGPATKEEKADCDWLVERRSAFAEELAWLKDELETAADPSHRADLEDEIQLTERVLEVIENSLPEKGERTGLQAQFGGKD